jgi:hypothetical protein
MPPGGRRFGRERSLRQNDARTRRKTPTMTTSARAFARLALIAAISLLQACVYEAPITATPTRDVDMRLVGDWASADGKEQVKVRKLDRRTYVIEYNGELFHAWHSDVAGVPLVSVQDLTRPERKFAYVAYSLSADGQSLRAQAVSRKTIPENVRSSREAQALVARHRTDPALFVDEPLELTRKP